MHPFVIMKASINGVKLTSFDTKGKKYQVALYSKLYDISYFFYPGITGGVGWGTTIVLYNVIIMPICNLLQIYTQQCFHNYINENKY